MKRRILAVLLTAAMLCTLLPATALAVDHTIVEIVPCEYDDAEDFSNGLAAVMRDKRRKTWSDYFEDWTYFEDWGFIDKTGREVIPCGYNDARDFSETLAAVGTSIGGTHKGFTTGDLVRPFVRGWGYIDKTGEIVVPGKYTLAYDFSEGLAAVRIGEYPNDKWGYINVAGEEVVPCIYDDAGAFSEGIAAVMGHGNWGCIDKTGKEVVPCTYSHIAAFSEGRARVSVYDGGYGYIDTTGKEVIPCTYSGARNFSGGLAAVQTWNGWGFINATGREIVPCMYRMVEDFSEGLAVVEREDDWTWGYVDTTGREVIPCQYHNAESFSEGLAAVCVGEYPDDKWGYINAAGEEAIPCIYDDAGAFSEGFAAVKKGDLWGYIDKMGKEVVPYKYNEANSFSDGIARVCLNDKYGFLADTSRMTATAYPSAQMVEVDGKPVTFQCYALEDANGNRTNYIKLRDLAMRLNGTPAQFEVGFYGVVNLASGWAYTPNGSENSTPFSGERQCTPATQQVNANGKNAALAAFTLTDDNGGGYTYYRLRDLGRILDFNVGWSNEYGMFLETDKPYSDAD